MKLTESHLRNIVRQELKKTIKENWEWSDEEKSHQSDYEDKPTTGKIQQYVPMHIEAIQLFMNLGGNPRDAKAMEAFNRKYHQHVIVDKKNASELTLN